MKSWNNRYQRRNRLSRKTSNSTCKRLIENLLRLLRFLAGNQIVSVLNGKSALLFIKFILNNKNGDCIRSIILCLKDILTTEQKNQLSGGLEREALIKNLVCF